MNGVRVRAHHLPELRRDAEIGLHDLVGVARRRRGIRAHVEDGVGSVPRPEALLEFLRKDEVAETGACEVAPFAVGAQSVDQNQVVVTLGR